MSGSQNLGGDVTPIYVTVKDAATILGGTSPWTIYRLCKTGAIESRFRDNRRLVLRTSLLEYAHGLPAHREESA